MIITPEMNAILDTVPQNAARKVARNLAALVRSGAITDPDFLTYCQAPPSKCLLEFDPLHNLTRRFNGTVPGRITVHIPTPAETETETETTSPSASSPTPGPSPKFALYHFACHMSSLQSTPEARAKTSERVTKFHAERSVDQAARVQANAPLPDPDIFTEPEQTTPTTPQPTPRPTPKPPTPEELFADISAAPPAPNPNDPETKALADKIVEFLTKARQAIRHNPPNIALLEDLLSRAQSPAALRAADIVRAEAAAAGIRLGEEPASEPEAEADRLARGELVVPSSFPEELAKDPDPDPKPVFTEADRRAALNAPNHAPPLRQQDGTGSPISALPDNYVKAT